MTECLLCKEQIKEKGSFLRLFLLKRRRTKLLLHLLSKF